MASVAAGLRRPGTSGVEQAPHRGRRLRARHELDHVVVALQHQAAALERGGERIEDGLQLAGLDLQD